MKKNVAKMKHSVRYKYKYNTKQVQNSSPQHSRTFSSPSLKNSASNVFQTTTSNPYSVAKQFSRATHNNQSPSRKPTFQLVRSSAVEDLKEIRLRYGVQTRLQNRFRLFDNVLASRRNDRLSRRVTNRADYPRGFQAFTPTGGVPGREFLALQLN